MRKGPNLSKKYRYKDTEVVKISLLEICVLLSNLHIGARDNEVGFEDSENTIETIEGVLNRDVLVPVSLVESTLWSCNLLNEQGKFFHPKERSFESFLSTIQFKLKRKFNKLRNYFEDTKHGKTYV